MRDTNSLKSSITNNLSYSTPDYFTNSGFKNNMNLYFKNLNSVGKKDQSYGSSPSIKGMGLFEISSSLPLVKNNDLSKEILIPKISFRANPVNDMIDYSSSSKVINADNVFAINRLGLSDTFEQGKSITLGLNYKFDKNSYIDEENELKDKFLEIKLATVLRDSFEEKIPKKSTINQKSSNIFGSINNNLLDNINLKYDFSIDNNLKTFDSHSITSEVSINNFVTEFGYIEERNKLGTTHSLTNKTSYNFNESNSFSFSTRRNKEISLTEYYDLSYEYKNDCLTAAIKYNRTFYKDDDLVPSENLFLSVTLIPLTTYERKLYERDQYGN